MSNTVKVLLLTINGNYVCPIYPKNILGPTDLVELQGLGVFEILESFFSPKVTLVLAMLGDPSIKKTAYFMTSGKLAF